MIIKASGRAGLILAAGLWVCFAGPSQAASADDADSTATPVVKQSTHHSKPHKSGKTADKSSDARTANAAAGGNPSAPQSSQLAPSIANANAQLATDTPASNDAKAMTERANNIVQATPDNAAATQPAPDNAVVAPDQLNDIDRALHETPPPAPPMAAATADAQQAAPANPPAPPAAAASNGNSSWDQASLIGKIFIGFGALLTVASAARMFIA